MLLIDSNRRHSVEDPVFIPILKIIHEDRCLGSTTMAGTARRV